MSKCRDTEVNADITAHAMHHLNECAEYGIANGMIPEAYLDEKNIYTTPQATVRDGLVECRRHAFLVTHVDSVQRHAEALERRQAAATAAIDRHDPVRIQVVNDMRVIASDDNKLVKKILAAEKKAQEKARFSSLSKEEQQSEVAKKKELAALKKADKQAVVQAARLRMNSRPHEAEEAMLPT